MRKIINMLKKNDNAYSVGRICAVIGFAVWVLVTLWLAFWARTWGNYESCTLGMVALCLCSWATRPLKQECLK